MAGLAQVTSLAEAGGVDVDGVYAEVGITE